MRICGPGSTHEITKISRERDRLQPSRWASPAQTPAMILPLRGRLRTAMGAPSIGCDQGSPGRGRIDPSDPRHRVAEPPRYDWLDDPGRTEERADGERR